MAQSLVKTVRPVGRPSLDEFKPPHKKAARVQQNPTKDIQKDGVQHILIYNENGSVVYIVRYRFPISAAKDEMFGFV